MAVLAYDGVVLDGATIMVEMSILVVLFRIVLDVFTEFMSLRDAVGSIDVLIALLLIASVIGEDIGIGDVIVVIVEVSIGLGDDLSG